MTDDRLTPDNSLTYLSPLMSEASFGEGLSELKSSFFLKTDHMMGVIQMNDAKDRKPALSRGLGLETKAQIKIHVGSLPRLSTF